MKKTTYIIIACLCMALSAFAQTDKTSSIKNPSFETYGYNYWTNENLSLQSNTSFTKKVGDFYLEKWVSSGSSVGNAKIYQKLTNLPMGKYTLTVSAQNLNQSSTSKKCTGAYIYAGDQQTPVYTPDDYSVDFTCISGEVEVGFVAKSATGNWLAVDNFRLTLNEEIGNDVALAELNKQLAVADSLSKFEFDEKVQTNLNTAMTTAKAMTTESASTDIQSALVNLNAAISNAEFAIKLANATPGTGSVAPGIKSTYTAYVPTGATEALMRFTYLGSNIIEKGVCWSTEHNPTVLDNRATETFVLNGYIFHITGLTPATVYYLRPYVINSTYTVAYGDEVKIVTHPKGNCSWSWDNAGPDVATNTRCRTAIKQTIDYFNEWTGIQGFTLSGHYVPGAGSGSGTADCSYGGYMRISQNEGNQAIGTVLHETGHGVGVGTQDRYWNTNVHNWKWYGREANKVYSFLENKTADPYESEFCVVGDATHAWGASASYDWLINGADKDKHTALQYIGGCCLLYGMFIDGLCPTSSYNNGLAGYTFNFDEDKKYYIMCKDSVCGLGSALLYANTFKTLALKDMLADNVALPDEAAWNLAYDAKTGYYTLKNVAKKKYLSSRSGYTLYATSTLKDTEYFQLMPDRTDVKITTGTEPFTTHGYWLASKTLSALSANTTSYTGNASFITFNYADTATKQQWIILSEDDINKYWPAVSGIVEIAKETSTKADGRIYNVSGQYVGKDINALHPGLYIINGKKIVKK